MTQRKVLQATAKHARHQSRAPNPERATRQQLARAHGIRERARSQLGAIGFIMWAYDARSRKDFEPALVLWLAI